MNTIRFWLLEKLKRQLDVDDDVAQVLIDETVRMAKEIGGYDRACEVLRIQMIILRAMQDNI